MSGHEDREELPFRVFRKAARLGLQAAKQATEATLKVAKNVPKALPKPPGPVTGQGETRGETRTPQTGSGAVPFRARKTARTRLHRSPLESRPAGIMEYTEAPRLRLHEVAGASTAIPLLRRALEGYSGRVLISGPPGTGKSVLALAYAVELGKKIIDIDAGNHEVHEDGGALLKEAMDFAKSEDYTVVIYNIEGLVKREYAGRIIIYDPYTDDNKDEPKIIIYDPYTDQQPDRIIIYDPYMRTKAQPSLTDIVAEAMDSGVRVIATATAPHVLPVELRRRFQATVSVGLPNYQDRLEILYSAIGGSGLEGVTVEELAAATHGASANDLVILAKRLRGAGQPITRDLVSSVLRESRFLGERIVEALYK